MRAIRKGDHVVLAANEEEGWPEECGWVLTRPANETFAVGLCSGELDPGDDGLRDVTVDQVAVVETYAEVLAQADAQ